jgi:hypothetical protein
LEDEIKEREDEFANKENSWQAQVTRLEAEVQRFSGEVHGWRIRCEGLGKQVEQERLMRLKVERDCEDLRMRSIPSITQNKQTSESTDAVPIRRRAKKPVTQEIAPPDLSDPHLLGCGNCTSEGRCKCVEDSVNFDYFSPESQTAKRPHSPHYVPSKRNRPSPPTVKTEPSESLETDFTAIFSKAPVDLTENIMNSPTVMADPCGFCSDGTPCLCAAVQDNENAAAAAAAQQQNSGHGQGNRLPPLLSHFTPPPSDSDVSPRLPSLHPNHLMTGSSSSSRSSSKLAPPTNDCSKGPGTCAQCQADPNSTLFCKSLAVMKGTYAADGSTKAAPPEGCCGGGCCGEKAAASESSGSPAVANTPAGRDKDGPVYLSCADTYTTLSRHPKYSEASEEMGSWLGRLNAVPSADKGGAGRRPSVHGPMEVEAATVMGALKMFDRRFGSS